MWCPRPNSVMRNKFPCRTSYLRQLRHSRGARFICAYSNRIGAAAVPGDACRYQDVTRWGGASVRFPLRSGEMLAMAPTCIRRSHEDGNSGRRPAAGTLKPFLCVSTSGCRRTGPRILDMTDDDASCCARHDCAAKRQAMKQHLRSAPGQRLDAARPALLRFLSPLSCDFSMGDGGAVADYPWNSARPTPSIWISSAPRRACLRSATRGSLHDQSMEPFVFALAVLDTLGAGAGGRRDRRRNLRDPSIGSLNAKPSSIRVVTAAPSPAPADHEAKGDGAFEYIVRRSAGLPGVNRHRRSRVCVESRPATNRAIVLSPAQLHRNQGRGRAVLESLFPAMLGLVTACDMRSCCDARQLGTIRAARQVMTPTPSRGRFGDDAFRHVRLRGEWIYRSASGQERRRRRILAALRRRLGLGSYSPGSTATARCAASRSARRCHELRLHMLNAATEAQQITRLHRESRRGACRRPGMSKRFSRPSQDVRIIELVGTLTFSGVDYVSRQLAAKPRRSSFSTCVGFGDDARGAGAHGNLRDGAPPGDGGENLLLIGDGCAATGFSRCCSRRDAVRARRCG